jgi:hypothetical protein
MKITKDIRTNTILKQKIYKHDGHWQLKLQLITKSYRMYNFKIFLGMVRRKFARGDLTSRKVDCGKCKPVIHSGL